MSSSRPVERDTETLAHVLVQHFLEREGYETTSIAFRREAEAAGRFIPATDPAYQWLDLRNLIEVYSSRKLAEAAEGQKGQAANIDLKSLVLPGPSTLPWTVTDTWTALHTSNILSIRNVLLPTRYFDTSTSQPSGPGYRIRRQRCLATTSADRRIVFTNIDSNSPFGEVVDVLEAAKDGQPGHTAPVLCLNQHPSYEREMVACGMDSKVVIWDLLRRAPCQVLNDHRKFVVRCCYSPCGRYIATASYDRTVCIYRRRADAPTELGDDTGDDPPEILDPGYKLLHTLRTATNPECILFVKSPSERVFLAFALRNSCLIQYLVIPESPEGEDSAITDLSAQTDRLQLQPGDGLPPPNDATVSAGLADWKVLAWNTNFDPNDFHVSYSFLSIDLHPSQRFISVQTGDHSMPASGTAMTSSSPMSRIILFPILSGQRIATLWTGAASSAYAAPRQAWLRSGTGVWVTGEDGMMRLVDLKNVIRTCLPVHGAAIEAATRSATATTAEDRIASAASWSRGGNTVIKDVAIIDDDGTFASCGFDRTVRIVRPVAVD